MREPQFVERQQSNSTFFFMPCCEVFTFYLLKKLQDTKGEVTLQELGDYIVKNVSQQSILLNGKSQTPCVTPSSAVGGAWREWRLK